MNENNSFERLYSNIFRLVGNTCDSAVLIVLIDEAKQSANNTSEVWRIQTNKSRASFLSGISRQRITLCYTELENKGFIQVGNDGEVAINIGWLQRISAYLNSIRHWKQQAKFCELVQQGERDIIEQLLKLKDSAETTTKINQIEMKQAILGEDPKELEEAENIDNLVRKSDAIEAYDNAAPSNPEMVDLLFKASALYYAHKVTDSIWTSYWSSEMWTKDEIAGRLSNHFCELLNDYKSDIIPILRKGLKGKITDIA